MSFYTAANKTLSKYTACARSSSPSRPSRIVSLRSSTIFPASRMSIPSIPTCPTSCTIAITTSSPSDRSTPPAPCATPSAAIWSGWSSTAIPSTVASASSAPPWDGCARSSSVRRRVWPIWRRCGSTCPASPPWIRPPGLCCCADSPTSANPPSSTRLRGPRSTCSRTPSRPSPSMSVTPTIDTSVGRSWTPPVYWTIPSRSATPSRCRR
mmetsp:Transcript_38296/g.114680  ORF Transcript_38296/g.114680 Transcript_38296/m.114680 type:complete len:210 (+) Transcript_38296:134-763(+)